MSGLLGCGGGDWWTFGTACLCPCGLLWKNAQRLDPVPDPCCQGWLLPPWALGAMYGVTFSAVAVGICGSPCIPWDNLPVLMLGQCCGACVHQPVREAIRKRYGIHPSGKWKCSNERLDDCCTALLCYSCALMQERAQVDVPYQTEATVNSMRLPMTMG